MSEYTKPPKRFLASLRGWKNSTFDESHLLANMPTDANERKHKRFPGEAFLLQQITASYEGILEFNQSVPPNLDDQFQALEKSLADHVSKSLSSRDDLRVAAVHIAPYLRKRDREHFLFNAERMNYEDAAVATVIAVLHNSLHGSLLDDHATVNTMAEMVLLRFPNASSSDTAEILRRSTQSNEWFAHSHGKYDDPMKKEMGRFDEDGNDLLHYDLDFFRWEDGNKGPAIQLDTDRLSSFREYLKETDPASTDEIHCPAVYSQLIDRMWNGVIDIYEKTNSLGGSNLS